MTDRLIRKPEVLRKTGLSHTTLYRLIKQGQFPAPLRISARISVWQESLVDKWIEERIKASASKKIIEVK